MKISHIEKEYTTKEGYQAVIQFYKHHRCGYVGVPKHHIAYGLDVAYTSCLYSLEAVTKKLLKQKKILLKLNNAGIHGGITFNDKNTTFYKGKKKLWFFGFDTNHSDDRYDYKAIIKYLCENKKEKQATIKEYLEDKKDYPEIFHNSKVRTLNDCINECNILSKKLKKMEHKK